MVERYIASLGKQRDLALPMRDFPMTLFVLLEKEIDSRSSLCGFYYLCLLHVYVFAVEATK